jgi:hypothetical protein
MKEPKNWVIIDTRSRKPLIGINSKNLEFSTYEIALEVAVQFFNVDSHYLIFDKTLIL